MQKINKGNTLNKANQTNQENNLTSTYTRSLFTEIIIERFLDTREAKCAFCTGRACRMLIYHITQTESADLLTLNSKHIIEFLDQWCPIHLQFDNSQQAYSFLNELYLFFQYLDRDYAAFAHAAQNAKEIRQYNRTFYTIRTSLSEEQVNMQEETFLLTHSQLCKALRQVSTKLKQLNKGQCGL